MKMIIIFIYNISSTTTKQQQQSYDISNNKRMRFNGGNNDEIEGLEKMSSFNYNTLLPSTPSLSSSSSSSPSYSGNFIQPILPNPKQTSNRVTKPNVSVFKVNPSPSRAHTLDQIDPYKVKSNGRVPSTLQVI